MFLFKDKCAVNMKTIINISMPTTEKRFAKSYQKMLMNGGIFWRYCVASMRMFPLFG